MEYMTELRKDFGYALRVLRRTPGFTVVAVATLALGIGASTAMFTVVDSVLLRPLRFPEPERLTMIRATAGFRHSPIYLHEWRLEGRAFHDIAGWYDVRANLTGLGEPLEVLVDRSTSNFFSVLGTPALLGRTFTTATDLSDVKPEVVLSGIATARPQEDRDHAERLRPRSPERSGGRGCKDFFAPEVIGPK